MNYNLKNKNLFLNSFGWSWRAWTRSFLSLDQKLLDEILNTSGKVLEVGPGMYSQVSTIFHKAANIDLGVYKYSADSKEIKSFLTNKFLNKKNYNIIDCDIKKFNGKYNLIIMKSVLGGIFRKGSSTNSQVVTLIDKIVENNLIDGGYFITLDNGIGFFDYLRKNYGAKKNKWRFFKPNNLKSKYLEYQSIFGFFSCFSLAFKIPLIGKLFDNFCFLLDEIIDKLFSSEKFKSSIIVSVYKKNNDKNNF